MMFRWCQRWLKGQFAVAKKKPSRRPSWGRVSLESLEDRLAPATYTWRGTASGLWSNPQNWVGSNPPQLSDPEVRLIFGTEATSNRTTMNDIAGGPLRIVDINFAAEGYTLGGNPLSMNLASSLQTMGATALTARINLNLTLAGTTQITVAQAGSTVILGGVLGGAGGITKLGTGRLEFTGTAANNYTGNTLVNAGVLTLNKTAGVNAIAGNLGIGDGMGGANADILRLATANQIADTSLVTVNASGQLDLAGFAETVTSVLGAGNVTLGAATLTFGGTNASFTFQGVMSGSGGLTKVGTGVVTLSGVNTYTGATNVNAGTLTMGAANTLASTTALTMAASATLNLNGNNLAVGSLAGAGNVTLGTATLTVGQNNSSTSYTGILSGTGGLTKVGTGTLTLGSANTYTGATTSNGGTLQMGVLNALAAGTAVTVGTDATLNLANFALTIASLSGAGNVTLGSATLTVNGTTNTSYTGVMSDTGGLTKAGTSTLTLGGVNTYTGATTINGGTLQMGVASALAAATAATVGMGATLNLANFNLTVASLAGAGNVTLGSATLTVSGTTSTSHTGIISGTGGLTKAGTSTLTLGGVSTYTGATTINAGTLLIGVANALASTTAATVAASATLNLASRNLAIGSLAGAGSVLLGTANLIVGQNNTATSFTGVIRDTGGLIKVGTAALTLGGVNTYTGATTVNAGTLQLGVANALAAATVATVGAGATLDLANFALTVASLAGAGIVTLGSATLTVSGTVNTSFAGVMSGTGGLTKAGTSTLTLGGVSTYTGATTINAGTLQIGVANALANTTAVTVAATGTLNLNGINLTIGSLAGAGNVTLGIATLTVGQNNSSTSYTGVLSGTGGLTKVGTGTLTLGRVATYTGATAINGGTFTLGVANALAAGAAVTVGTGATLNLANFALTIASLAGAGNVTLGSATLTVDGTANTSYTGVISGTGGLTKAGTSTLTLSGLNTYVGATTINGGTLTAGLANALPTASAVTVAGGATLSLNNFNLQTGSLAGAGIVDLGSATLTVGTAASTTFSGTIRGTGGLTKAGTGTLTVSGFNIYLGATTVNAGTLALGGGSALPNGTAVTIATGATLNLAGNSATIGSLSGAGNLTLGAATLNVGGNNASSTFTGVISGTGGLAKAGSGTLTLGGNNTYTNNTVVNGGTLLVNGTQTASAVVVSVAATLGGSGSVGDVTLAGIVAPGTGPGRLTARSIRFVAGSTYRAEINGTTPGTGHDQLSLTGDVNLVDGPDLSGVLGYTPATNDRIVLITTTGQVTGNFRNLPNGAFLALNGQNFRVSYNDGGNNVVLTRAAQDTTTALVTFVSPSRFGQAVRFTATVTATSGTPTGMVTFLDGTTVLGTANLASGQAEFTTSALSVASHPITARYEGDPNFGRSTSAVVTQIVDKAATASVVTSSANPAGVGQEITFTATVTAMAPGAGNPTGLVTFFDGTTSLGTGTLTNGLATFRTSTLTIGSHTIAVEYAGDGNFLTSRSPGLTQTVGRTATTTTVSSNFPTAVFGQPVTFTATVAATSGTGTPTGRVTFRDGETALGTGELTNGRATFSPMSLTVGPHSIRAVYDGNATFDASTSVPLSQTVNQAGTTIVVTFPGTALVFGQSLTLTATLSVTAPGAGTPTGSITFRDGTTVLGTSALTNGRTATLDTSSLPVGTRSLTVEYAGDTNFGRSTSGVVSQNVNRARTTISLATSSSSVAVDADVTFTATATVQAPGSGVLQGAVVFRDGNLVIGRAPLARNGIATLTTTGLFGGSRQITASFEGDASFEGSTSTNVAQTITGTTNQFYVAGLFRTVLQRAGDRSGIAFWANQLQAGSARLDVTRGFWRSAEYAGIQVDRFYQTYLRRAAEPGGRDFWIRAFQAGASESDVQRGFMTSQEYRTLNQTDTSFVGALYQDVLGRPLDPTASAAFIQRLQNGESRDSVSLLFLTTAERIGRVIDQYYLDLLGRSSDPAGRQGFVNLITSGGSVLLALGEGITNTPEFFSHVGAPETPPPPPTPPRPPTPPPRPPSSPPRPPTPPGG